MLLVTTVRHYSTIKEEKKTFEKLLANQKITAAKDVTPRKDNSLHNLKLIKDVN